MDIVFFSHPDFVGHQSMQRLTKMLAKGMEGRGHKIEIWSPSSIFFNFRFPNVLKKWMGYIDQYILFPKQVKRKLQFVSKNTLFVFTDQALGPWVPIVANRPHIIHCNDFLAQRSALGEIPDNPTSWTGRKYQSYIRRGYKKGKNFISISNKTEQDLFRFLGSKPIKSNVVYLGMNNSFEPQNIIGARDSFSIKQGINLHEGYLLHVGGNQWYKNRIGVIEIYHSWRSTYPAAKLPLILIGEEPSQQLFKLRDQSKFKEDIHFLSKVEDKYVRAAYAGASILLFPSLAEGFGWPIAEAMASGCLVITTNEAPMTEVAGDSGFLIESRPRKLDEIKSWALKSAGVVQKVLDFSTEERNKAIKKGLENIQRFNTDKVLDKVERIYQEVMGNKYTVSNKT